MSSNYLANLQKRLWQSTMLSSDPQAHPVTASRGMDHLCDTLRRGARAEVDAASRKPRAAARRAARTAFDRWPSASSAWERASSARARQAPLGGLSGFDAASARASAATAAIKCVIDAVASCAGHRSAALDRCAAEAQPVVLGSAALAVTLLAPLLCQAPDWWCAVCGAGGAPPTRTTRWADAAARMASHAAPVTILVLF